MCDLTTHADEDLVDAARADDKRALDVLVARHEGLVRRTASRYFLPGGEHADLAQEGMIGLLSAIRDYDRGRSPSFAGFAHLCVRRQIVTAIRTAQCLKHRALNTAISLEAAPDPKVGVYGPVVAVITDPADLVGAADWHKHMRKRMYACLTTLELEALRLHLGGATHVQVAARLRRSPKTADNAIQRGKRKLDARLRERMLAEAG